MQRIIPQFQRMNCYLLLPVTGSCHLAKCRSSRRYLPMTLVISYPGVRSIDGRTPAGAARWTTAPKVRSGSSHRDRLPHRRGRIFPNWGKNWPPWSIVSGGFHRGTSGSSGRMPAGRHDRQGHFRPDRCHDDAGRQEGAVRRRTRSPTTSGGRFPPGADAAREATPRQKGGW